MPAIMARLVINTGRSRSTAAARAACGALAPFRRFCSAKLTSYSQNPPFIFETDLSDCTIP
jgi:hypothetical protein